MFSGSSAQGNQKFDLLFLEEGEHYIQDFYGKANFYDIVAKQYRTTELKIHFCSRSIILEFHKDSSQPLYKYLLRYFIKEPSFNKDHNPKKNNSLPMKIYCERIVEVAVNSSIPKPYIYHQCKKDIQDIDTDSFEVSINIEYQDVAEFYQALRDLYILFKQKGFQYEDNLDELIFQHYSFSKQVLNGQFNKTLIKKLNEKPIIPYEIKIKYIIPLVSLDGLIFITNERIYMQPLHPQVLGKPSLNIKLQKVKELFKRRYTLMDLGLEIVSYQYNDNMEQTKKKTMFMVFKNTQERDMIYSILLQQVNLNDCATTEKNVEFYTGLWLNNQMSNFDYLMILNSYAQRSFQDLTQYPVMPWVINDFKSTVLDLNDPRVYRDLSKPIGALNPQRLAEFRQRYDETPPDMDRFLFGSHFSCPGYVIGYLLRSNPQWMIKFQSGRFDNPNRMFKGINKEWNSCNNNPTNVKELIPEFFMNDPRFLENRLNLDLGVRSNGKRVEDVKLPKWAQTSEEFLKIQRQALENDLVSNNLHLWIDLTFGCKQNSIEYNNVYHPYSYEGFIDFTKIKDVDERKAYETHIREFGQTPRQIFKKLHPRKGQKLNLSNQIQISEKKEINSSENKDKTQQQKIEQQNIEKLNNQIQEKFSQQKNDFDDLNNSKAFIKLIQQEEISHVIYIDQANVKESLNNKIMKFVTTTNDGFIKMNEIDLEKDLCSQKKSFFVCSNGISVACQLSGQESFALAGKNFSIYIFSFQTGTCINEFYAHDDFISTILFYDAKLISCSTDQTIKIWDLKKQGYDNDPLTIYDHDEEIVCADVRQSDGLFASMDIMGTIHIRSIKSLNQAETLLFTIRDIPKSPDDYAKMILNQINSQNNSNLIMLLINDQIIILDAQGRQNDQIHIKKDNQLLKVENFSICDNKFIFKLLFPLL